MFQAGQGWFRYPWMKNQVSARQRSLVKRFFGKAVFVAGIFGPIMTLPQLFKIWVEKNAAGVSLVTWAAYLLSAAVWFAYGIIHKNKPIIVSFLLWIFLELLIVLGVILYG